MTFKNLLGKQISKGSYILRLLPQLQKQDPSKLTTSYYASKLELLESYWRTFESRQEELLEHPEFAEADFAKEGIYDQVEEAYVSTKAALRQQIKILSDSRHEENAGKPVITNGRGKLPKLAIPIFSGNPLEWETFRDLFHSAVHTSPDLSDAAKLQHLKTLLAGEAAKVIGSVSVTDANYAGAWEAVVARYDDPKLLVHHHLERLLELKPMDSESATALRYLLDITVESRRALGNLSRPVEHWDDWFVHLTVQKLHPHVRKGWEMSQGSSRDLPTFQALTQHLEGTVRALSALPDQAKVAAPTASKGKFKRVNAHHALADSHRRQETCPVCQKDHSLGRCPRFLSQPVTERREIATKHQRCFNCLRKHKLAECPSKWNCHSCQRRHHTTLHLDRADPTPTTHVHTTSGRTQQTTLLATALIRVTAPGGRSAVVRALLDQGSEATFISEDLCQRLRLPRSAVSIPISGIEATPCGTVRAKINARLSSVRTKPQNHLDITAYVLPRLSRSFQPPKAVSQRWTHLQNLQLADPADIPAYKVQIVIGADLYQEVLLNGVAKGDPGSPIAQETIFGWVLSGRMDNQPSLHVHSLTTFHCSLDHNLLNELRRFWEVEEGPRHPHRTPEEQACEEHFRRTHSRASDGRFCVRLPRRSTITLGTSYTAALRSLQRSELRQRRDESLRDNYQKFMQEYLSLGHMSPVTSNYEDHRCYLPHHAVWKTDGQSRKIRVVFNASARTASGCSLNDLLLPGPKLQLDITHVLLRWRRHAVVFTTDIVKMFRQIWVHPEDRALQTILWREHPDHPLQEFQLNTVTYGTASAPFLAIRCLLQLAEEEGERFPEAAQVIRTQTYVDDIFAGADSEDEALHLKHQLQQFLMAGGFTLAKWSSNLPGLIEASNQAVPLTEGIVKTLGLQWHPDTDTFRFRVTLEALPLVTKRSVLSCIAKLYDPLGWLAPVLVKAKLFMQDLWMEKTDWDTALPSPLQDSWNEFYASLPDMEQIRIPRWISLTQGTTYQIHGFCDASQRAYAAAVYLRVESSNGRAKVHLLIAKTRVAPVKVVSLPRLELCGAVLLARLIRQIKDIFPEADSTHAWTDSQVVLCWLRAHPSRWQTFVANRTSEIHQLAPNTPWHHVASGENAADPASRGIQARSLVTETLWWHGPSWLARSPASWPKPVEPTLSPTAKKEERPILALHTTGEANDSLQDRYSSLRRLFRITAWLLRFAHNATATPEHRRYGPITTYELNNSQTVWIRATQREAFQQELQALRRGLPLQKGSPLLPLRPFIDNNGLLRVGGRLENSPCDYEEKHPYILPGKTSFTRLLITDVHHRVLHGGPQLTMSQLSRRFWILQGRRQVRSVIRACVRCARYNTKPVAPLMGQLPAERVTPSRPFLHTGLDYAGPIPIRNTKGRGHQSRKGYIALFICMTTKAVHLEAVSDCSTNGFIAAFKRFCSRRGTPATLNSDQATNFRGADAELRQLLQEASQQNTKIADLLANDGTQWRFIPPHSPHFGGLWEAGVRSVKHHLRRTIGSHTLTYEELSTVLAEIEACLNSRPITPISSSAQDCAALTPGHFLIGTPLKTIPEPSLLATPENRLSRWQLLRRLYEQFWHRWSKEYLLQLQQRSKW